jgi:phosphoglycolate phosphatase-like HAD superfamily hydrolase
MNLAVFDLDGTLIGHADSNDNAYLRAFEEVFSIVEIDTDWSGYAHATDSHITPEIVRRHSQRELDDAELQRFLEHYAELLRDRIRRVPGSFAEIDGASALLDHLFASGGWCATIATGGWRMTAHVKLAAARLDRFDLPGAYADDAHSREGIIECAIEEAKKKWDVVSFDRVVSIGDGVWDVLTARRLALPFVGVASGDQAAQLRSLGASTIIESYRDIDHVLAALAGAVAP